MAADPIIAAYDAAARLGRPEVQRLAFEAFQILRREIHRNEVKAALQQRSPVPIFESPAWGSYREALLRISAQTDEGPLLRVMDAAFRKTLRVTPVADATAFEWEAVYDTAREWLDREGAKMVTGITDGTRAAIRRTVSEAFSETTSVRQAARKMLDIKGFGLTHRQAGGFRRYVQSAIHRQLPGTENYTAKGIQRLIDVRYRKMLRQRAERIARTETYNAASAAQRELWGEAVAQRQLDADLYVLEWVTRPIRVCPRCIALAGKTAEIRGGVFTSDPVVGGGKFDGTQIVVERPTVHTGCYCALRVIRRPTSTESNVYTRAPIRLRIVLVEQARASWAQG